MLETSFCVLQFHDADGQLLRPLFCAFLQVLIQFLKVAFGFRSRCDLPLISLMEPGIVDSDRRLRSQRLNNTLGARIKYLGLRVAEE
jgi:hypothetical protein